MVELYVKTKKYLDVKKSYNDSLQGVNARYENKTYK